MWAIDRLMNTKSENFLGFGDEIFLILEKYKLYICNFYLLKVFFHSTTSPFL